MHAGLAGAPASESAAGDVRNAGGCGPGTVALPGAAIDPRRDDEPRPAGMWPAGAPAVCDGPRHEARRAPGRCARPAGMWPAARRGGVPDSHGVSTTHVPHGFLPRPRPCPACGHGVPARDRGPPAVCDGPGATAVCQIPMRCRQRTSLTASCHVRGHARHPAGTFHPRPTLESRSSHAAETLGAARQASRNRRGPAYATPGENLAGSEGRLPAPGRIRDTGRESGRTAGRLPARAPRRAACRESRLPARAACRREPLAARAPLAGEGSSSPTPDLTSSSRRSRGRRRSCPRGRMPAPAGRPPCPRGSP